MFKTKTTMKKTYINPEMEIIKIKVQQLLSGSPVSFDNSGSGEVDLLDEDPDDGEAMSRAFDW